MLEGGEVRLRLAGTIVAAPLPPGAGSAQSAEQALTTLLTLLDASALRIGGLRLVASDRWLRPLVFPLSAQALSEQELEAVVEHQYRQVFGTLMAGWSCRWERQPNGRVLAMAWPEALLALRARLAERGVRLLGALPHSLAAMRSLALPPGPGWFVLVDAPCVTFVRFDRDGWRQWRVVAAQEASAEAVASQLLRLGAQADDDCRCVWLAAPGASAEWLAALRRHFSAAGWQAHLTGNSP